jgi:hypothetical protein
LDWQYYHHWQQQQLVEWCCGRWSFLRWIKQLTCLDLIDHESLIVQLSRFGCVWLMLSCCSSIGGMEINGSAPDRPLGHLQSRDSNWRSGWKLLAVVASVVCGDNIIPPLVSPPIQHHPPWHHQIEQIHYPQRILLWLFLSSSSSSSSTTDSVSFYIEVILRSMVREHSNGWLVVDVRCTVSPCQTPCKADGKGVAQNYM